MFNHGRASQHGFTIIETLVVIVIVGVVATMIVRIFSATDIDNVEREADKVISLIRDARSRTVASIDDMQYGIYATTTGVFLFQGGAFSTSTIEKQLVYDSAIQMSNSTLYEDAIVFQRLTGSIATSSMFTLSLIDNPASSVSIIISTSGVAEIIQ